VKSSQNLPLHSKTTPYKLRQHLAKSMSSNDKEQANQQTTRLPSC